MLFTEYNLVNQPIFTQLEIMRYGIIFTITVLLAQLGYGQTGTVRGKVMDSELGETLPGAAVVVAGTTTGAPTDMDGSYSIEGLAPGTYNLVCTFISYEADTIKGVEVKADEVTLLDFDMGAGAVEIDVFNVVAKQSRNNDNFMLAMQQKSASVMDGMSAQQMAKNGDSDAAGAVKRVTGVSVEGGKYVYVRGLSDRYSKTLLNGAEIPGLDPNRNSVQLDLFPTSLIENMTVVKSFTPDLPASFTGGLINLETKDFPDRYTFSFSTSQGFNTQANFRSDFLGYEGGKTDFAAIDDGARAIPDYVQANGVPFRSEDAEGLSQATSSFGNNWAPTPRSTRQNESYSVSIGNQTKLFKRTLGFNVGATYRKNYEFYQGGTTERYTLTSLYNDSYRLNTEKAFTDSRGDENVIWGALANLSYKWDGNNKFGLTVLRNQNGISSARYQNGRNPSDAADLFMEQRSLRYLERNMTSAQLKGEHLLPELGNVRIDWIGSYTLSNQNTPDLRVFTNDYQYLSSDADPTYSISANLYPVPTRYYREMDESNADAKVNVTIPFLYKELESSIKVGGSVVKKHRVFAEQWYLFSAFNLAYDGNPNNYFDASNTDATSDSYLFAIDATDAQNSYVADELVTGSYAMVDFHYSKRLRLIAGARFETTNIELVSDKWHEFERELANASDADATAIREQQAKFRGELLRSDLLPAVAGTYGLTDKQNLRFGYSRTLARPSFREIAPFSSFDFDYQFTKIGNPNIDRTLIDNFDVRWEWFPNAGELIAVSAYYKHFNNPIELVINPVAANLELTWKNQEYAKLLGTEVEVRKNLGAIASALQNYTIGVNATFVQSQTKVDVAELEQIRATDPDHADTRVMFGQSPYILNSFVGYKNDSLGLELNANFNVSGPKMTLVTKGGTPDVFDQPTGRLNFNVKKMVAKRWALSLSAGNLLNPTTRQIYTFKGKDYDFQTYKRGRTFSVGVKYTID